MSGLRTPPRRELLVAGAVLTVMAAVAFDLFAGEAPLHAATLGVITAMAAGLRVRLAGRHRSLLQFVCGCIISQPAIHYAAKLLPHADLEHGAGNVPGAADLFVAGIQTAVLLAVVVVLTYVEQAFLALAIRTFRLYVVRVRSIPRMSRGTRFVITVAPGAGPVVGHHYPGSVARRGPPVFAATG